MNTQNVNVNTATPESPKTWVNGHTLAGVSPALAADLAFLAGLRTERMTLDERAELLYGGLLCLAEQVCNAVTDWSCYRPRMPLTAWQAWLAAGPLVRDQCAGAGEEAWRLACRELAMLLKAGRGMHLADIA
ncbi:hypothetical protein [Pantoea agglomerans]|uniref:Uncharacterized protein n=1 Tax=Enterobacter agglomerans TaxID=549 RepID=A0AAN2K898_ENTAG|nr:hypothetical protein [Pantoea agglomerans]CAH6375718.1 hypothetical protein DAPPPG734_24010 [Pantoea agglomerans]